MDEIKINQQKEGRGRILKAVILAFALFQILSFYTTPAPVQAKSLAESLKQGQICAPNDDAKNSGTNIAECVNNIYVFSLVIGGFVAVLMFVFGGYLYTFGTAESVKEAKSIMGSTLAGLILLFIAYAFLNTLGGKQLTELKYIETLPEIRCPRGVDCTKTDADVLNMIDKSKAVPNAAGHPPDGILKAGCTFQQGIDPNDTGYLVSQMYTDIVKVCNTVTSTGPLVQISSIYGLNKHAPNSLHYRGCAVDFAGGDANFKNTPTGQAILKAAKALGYKENNDGGALRINPGTDQELTNMIHLDLGTSCPK